MGDYFEFGEHRFPVPVPLTNQELITICRVGQIKPGMLEDAASAGDYGFLVGTAFVSAERAGLRRVAEQILGAEVGTLRFVSEDEEQNGGPPSPVGVEAGLSPANPNGFGGLPR